MPAWQTACSSCNAELSASELADDSAAPSHLLICDDCHSRTVKVRRHGWQPVMLWDGGSEGLRLASQAPIPWKSANVAMIRITRGRQITTANTITGKRQMLKAMTPGDMLLAGWPGQYRQDVFVIDDLKAAGQALG
jgi:hypothetical protein